MTTWVSTNNRKFLFSDRLHDVVFEFPEEENFRIYAHSQTLAFCSDVFETQFFGSLPENEVAIVDSSVKDFQTFLRFLYTGELLLTLENVYHIAHLADKYRIEEMIRRISVFFVENIRKDDNLLKMFSPRSIQYFDSGEKRLLGKLLDRILEDPTKYINSQEFMELEEDAVDLLVRCENLAVSEFDLYKAVVKWAEYQCKRNEDLPNSKNIRELVKQFIYSVRMPTLTVEQLISSDGIFSNELLITKEKAAVLRYCGGDSTVYTPFAKMPRLKSLDTLAAFATGASTVVSGENVFSFTPQAHYRFIGLTCELDISDVGEKPVNIEFEIRDGDKTVCQFEWTAECRMEMKHQIVSCMAGDVYQLYKSRAYELIARPGAGVQFWQFKGNYYTATSGGTSTTHLVPNNASGSGVWPIKSFLLLPV